MTFRVTAPWFVAGFITRDGVVTEAAPILRRHVMGRYESDALDVCSNKRWRVERLP